jgi:hypothetical protein
MATRASLRASDADRDRVAERLRLACSEGRLFAHELEERLAVALRARTYGELDAVVSDLPASVAIVPSRRGARGLVQNFPVGVAVVGVVTGMVVMMTLAAVFAMLAAGLWLLPVVGVCVLSSKDRRGQGYSNDSSYGHRRTGGWHMDMHSHARRNQF